MNKLSKYHILLVEDVESILLAIRDYLISFFEVTVVRSSEEAKEKIDEFISEDKKIDLIISDIHLPGESGIELLIYIRNLLPDTKTALITSYDINDFIDYIQRETIDQVISKHYQMSLHDIMVMSKKLITNEIFGIEKYFEGIKVYYPTEIKNKLEPSNREIFSVTIKNSKDRIYWTDKIAEILEKERNVPDFLTKLVLDEVTTNAMIRAPKFSDGSYKYQKQNTKNDTLIPNDEIELDEEDYFIVQYGFYDNWVLLNCIDPHGNLRKKEVLYRLQRHISINQKTGLPDGLGDSHGRGIFLLREHLTHLVFNIERSKKTEVLCMINQKQELQYKNISIYEIE